MGEVEVLMAVPDAGCGYGEVGFSWQSQTLVVGERQGFSQQSFFFIL